MPLSLWTAQRYPVAGKGTWSRERGGCERAQRLPQSDNALFSCQWHAAELQTGGFEDVAMVFLAPCKSAEWEPQESIRLSHSRLNRCCRHDWPAFETSDLCVNACAITRGIWCELRTQALQLRSPPRKINIFPHQRPKSCFLLALSSSRIWAFRMDPIPFLVEH